MSEAAVNLVTTACTEYRGSTMNSLIACNDPLGHIGELTVREAGDRAASLGLTLVEFLGL